MAQLKSLNLAFELASVSDSLRTYLRLNTYTQDSLGDLDHGEEEHD